jgi:lipoate-protein ligase A
MHWLDLTLPTPEENLALDEALIEHAEQSARPLETLRVWEPASPLVVIGASSRIAVEVHLAECQKRGIPIFRRPSGGAAILTGPGCLMYAVVLSYVAHPELRAIDQAHRFVLETVLRGLQPLAPAAVRAGTSDLAADGRKFSGNSLRVKRNHLLYHGTMLYDFPTGLIDCCLAAPLRQPAYREGRPHHTFVANLPVTQDDLRRALRAAWQAEEAALDWPRDLTRQLVEEKYSRREWTYRH